MFFSLLYVYVIEGEPGGGAINKGPFCSVGQTFQSSDGGMTIAKINYYFVLF
ncbi:MAG: hypothetical protein WKF92_16780 [Pyrinomonadaceae bacterium]